MAKTRLNTGMRAAIMYRLLEHGFRNKVEKIMSEGITLAHEIFDLWCGDDLEQMEALPDGWLQHTNTFKVTHENKDDAYGPRVIMLSFTTGLFWWNWSPVNVSKNDASQHYSFLAERGKFNHDLPRFRRITQKQLSCYHFDLRNHKKLQKRLIDLLKQQEELLTEVRSATIQAWAILSNKSIKTIEDLIETWPEIETFAEAEKKAVPVASVQLPAVVPQQLNTLLELPPEALSEEA